MNTNITPLFEKTEFSHAYALVPCKQRTRDEEGLTSYQSPTGLEGAHLSIQEIAYPYFREKEAFTEQTDRRLKGEKISLFNHVFDVSSVSKIKKAIEVAFKGILREIEGKEKYTYLSECQERLKENFQQFYMRIKEG